MTDAALDRAGSPSAPATRWWEERIVVAALALTLGLLALRLLVIGRFGLFFDEAYYWLWSTNLELGYYDHPPMVAYFVRFGTMLFGDNEFGIRFMGAASLAVDAWLAYAIARTLFRERRIAAWAAIFTNLTIITIMAVVSLPDQPMILFWMAAMLGIAKVARGGSPWWWVFAGAMFGLSAASKYTALFLLAGVPLWLLFAPGLRRSLFRPHIYLGLLAGFLVFLPVLVWNAQNGWASFVLQYSRPAYEEPSLGSFLLYLGLIPLVITPPLFLLAARAGINALRRRPTDPGRTLLILVPLPLAIFLAWHSFGEETGFHWLSPIAVSAAILAASGLQGTGRLPQRSVSFLRKASLGFGLALTAIVYLALVQDFVSIPLRYDQTARFRGWPQFVANVEALRRETGADYIVGDQYYHPAYVGLYLDDAPPVFQLGEWNRWRQFPPADPALAGSTGLFIGKWSREVEEAVAERYFAEVEYLGPVARPIDATQSIVEQAFLVRSPTLAAAPLFNGWRMPDEPAE